MAGARRGRSSTSSAITQIVGALALEDRDPPGVTPSGRRTAPQGVRVVMITGDARQVAEAVGRTSASTKSSPRSCRRTRTQGRRATSSVARPWRWSETASTTPPPLPGPMSASRSAPAPTSPSNQPASILATSDPRAVVSVLRLSRASYRKMVENLVWAVGYNVVAIPLAAGVLAPGRRHPAACRRRHPDERVHHRRRPQRPTPAQR